MTRSSETAVSIQDIRSKKIEHSILDEIHDKLRPGNGAEKQLPTLLLYDERGLRLFEDISYLEEYYLTNAEIELLQGHATTLAAMIPDGCAILELGSGNLRKVQILLDALEISKKSVDYYALDLSEPELRRTISAIPKHYKHVRCHGLLGTYDDGLDWLQASDRQGQPKWILSMGSSIGNFSRDEAAMFLQGFADTMEASDSMLVGLDACQVPEKVYHAYNDKCGKTHEFILNGLLHANSLLEKPVFRLQDWKVIGEYDEAAGRHQAFVSPIQDLIVDGVPIKLGERLRIEESYKYSIMQSNDLWHKAGLVQRTCFGNSSNNYHLHILAKSAAAFALQPESYAAQPIPSLKEFKELWAAWDVVTQRMIPGDGLLDKPIKLRNSCIFYLGHIPTFLDIHLTRATDSLPTEPSQYRDIFERGIDPDVDNPELCHAHSEIPDEWPPVTEVLKYQASVRARVEHILGDIGNGVSAKAGRALWLGFEHEAMHLETLLYMLLQSDKTLPPPGPVPDFKALALEAQQDEVSNEWVWIPDSSFVVGMDDPETNHGPARYFGWDNEKPKRETHAPAFEAKARPLTNADFARYLYSTNQDTLPSSWARIDANNSHTGVQRGISGVRNGVYLNGQSDPLDKVFLKGKSVRTVFGLVELEYALAWPVAASYDELAGCAKWMNGRIPTADEVRSIYNYAEVAKTKEATKKLAKKISAVNGHLSNDGVEETPPSARGLNGSSRAGTSPDPQSLFADLEGCNVGFAHFCPTPVTQLGNKLCGRGEMGGLWEWTSSALEEHEGFKAMDLYPGYTGLCIYKLGFFGLEH
ncbi:MAG: hypothetical protein Q9222_006763 [Ikaeria aurantiellina]